MNIDHITITQLPTVSPNDATQPDYNCADCGQQMNSINIGNDGRGRCIVCHK